MRLAFSALLALSAAAAVAAPVETAKTMKASTPPQAVAALINQQPPKGWTVEEYANGNGADPVLAFVDGLDRIAVRVYGAAGSAYKSPASFLTGPAATTMGVKPKSAGSVTVAGRELALYKRAFPLTLGDPHAPSSASMLGQEIFCVLPISGRRFIVFSYSRESPAPDLERRGEKAWSAFLKSVKLAGRKT